MLAAHACGARPAACYTSAAARAAALLAQPLPLHAVGGRPAPTWLPRQLPCLPVGMLIAVIAHSRVASEQTSECSWYFVAFTFGGCRPVLTCPRRPELLCHSGKWQWQNNCFLALVARPPTHQRRVYLPFLLSCRHHSGAGADHWAAQGSAVAGALVGRTQSQAVQPRGSTGAGAGAHGAWGRELQRQPHCSSSRGGPCCCPRSLCL